MSAMQGRPTDPDDDFFSARSEVEYDEYGEYDEDYSEEDLEFEDEFEDEEEDEDEDEDDWDEEFEDYEVEEFGDTARKRRRAEWE